MRSRAFRAKGKPSSRACWKVMCAMRSRPMLRRVVVHSNKRCGHAKTHQCPRLADSNSSLCTPCAIAAASGGPCAL
ncbi:hypothetical protein VFPBJ_11368 [Purpureocillium lilacinum]|uniref:Uncharacterized protein n=1 Tax=Purpureocillium lilacinum TaxID=33203 RepID=A0A179FAU0_PURLI|nr:hypothetical protein VFPBJ_11368 [Purpureocillium lilacinum]